jgi:hypothetical protein
MKKIVSLFARDPQNPQILTDSFHPDAAWVVAGEGVATRKWDGTAVLVRGGKLFARYDVKRGRVAPVGFEPAQDPDPNTGHHPGWVPAERPEDKWIQAAAAGTLRSTGQLDDGTYEACGPKINGNPEKLDEHRLIRHGRFVLANVPRDKTGLLEFFRAHPVEGVVWWRREGDDTCDKVKITAEALGVEWPAR